MNNADCVVAEGVDIAGVYRFVLYCQTTSYQSARKCLRESGQTHRGNQTRPNAEGKPPTDFDQLHWRNPTGPAMHGKA